MPLCVQVRDLGIVLVLIAGWIASYSFWLRWPRCRCYCGLAYPQSCDLGQGNPCWQFRVLHLQNESLLGLLAKMERVRLQSEGRVTLGGASVLRGPKVYDSGSLRWVCLIVLIAVIRSFPFLPELTSNCLLI